MIEHVSALAQLQLNEEEKMQLQQDLEQILQYVDMLQEVEQQAVEQ